MNNFNKELKEMADRNFDKTMILGKLSGALYIEEKFLQAKPKTAEEAYQVIAQVRAEFDQAQNESIQQTIDDAVMTSERYAEEAKADHRTSEQFPNV